MPKADNRDSHLRRFAAFRADRDLRTAAFDTVGGGDYEMVGFVESLLLDKLAPVPENGLLVDVGCGPGRLARYLKNRPDLKYIGTDIVPELLQVAARECGREDWKFETVQDFYIPADTGGADVVVCFSILTNIYPEESFLILREASRVLHAGGRLLVSYFDIEVPSHREIFLDLVEHQKSRFDPLVFLNRQLLEFMAAENDFSNLTFIRPGEIHLTPKAGSRLLDGREITTDPAFSQMICVMNRI